MYNENLLKFIQTSETIVILRHENIQILLETISDWTKKTVDVSAVQAFIQAQIYLSVKNDFKGCLTYKMLSEVLYSVPR